MHGLRRNLCAVGRSGAARYLSSTGANNLRAHGNVLGGESITPESLRTFETWHRSVTSAMHADQVPDPEVLKETMYDCVDSKCKFYPPTYFTPWEGRDEMLLLLSCVSEVFGKSFVYGRQWLSPDGRDWALEFTANIGDSKKAITGIDLVKLNEEGKIVEFIVLARPPNGVTELKTQMMKKVPPRLAKLKLKQASESLSSLFG
jgi:hypothetical protein